VKALRKAFEALSNEKRLDILISLMDSGESNVGKIARKHKLTMTTTSRHLKILENAGLVRGNQMGRNVVYSAETYSPSLSVRSLLTLIEKSPKRRTR
jgi:DNA-binding transcriptional ArsR family regulator